MREPGKIILLLLVFFYITLMKVAAQSNTSWLQRSWEGRAFILSNGTKENYNIVLTITKIKGKTFEGVWKTIQPEDTAIHFNTKVDGFIYEKHMTINIGNWKVNCGNCKPQTLSFSIENGKFFLKGEAKGCSQECTWITVFSRDLAAFDLKTQDDLFAAAEDIIMEPSAELPVAENNEPPPPQPEVKKAPEPEVAKRIPILPAGAIVATWKNYITKASIKPPSKSATLPLKEFTSEKRIALPDAGAVVIAGKKQDDLNGSTKTDFDKNAGLKINDAVPEKRTALLPAGNTEKVNQKYTALSRPSNGFKAKPGLMVNDAIPDKKMALVPAGAVIVNNSKPLLTAGKTPANITNGPGLKVNDAIPEKRVPTLTDNSIVADKKHPDLEASVSKINATKNTGLIVDQSVPDKKIPLLPAGSIVASDKNSGSLTATQNKNALSNQPALNVDKKTNVKPPVIKDTLPEGYAERKKNVVKTVNVDTDSITLRLYDNGVVDGDIVSVVYNDKTVVDKLSLIARALVIKLPVRKEGINTIVFHAHNLGEFPPNTAQLEVLYGNKKEELTISSDYTISSAIDIIYQKKP